eukprot:1740790-Amphidinium_carterae.1
MCGLEVQKPSASGDVLRGSWCSDIRRTVDTQQNHLMRFMFRTSDMNTYCDAIGATCEEGQSRLLLELPLAYHAG